MFIVVMIAQGTVISASIVVWNILQYLWGDFLSAVCLFMLS